MGAGGEEYWARLADRPDCPGNLSRSIQIGNREPRQFRRKRLGVVELEGDDHVALQVDETHEVIFPNGRHILRKSRTEWALPNRSNLGKAWGNDHGSLVVYEIPRGSLT